MDLITAKNLKQGQEIYHIIKKNADGVTPMKAKVTSVKIWKRSPKRVLVKFKRGLYEYGSMDENELTNITDKCPV